MTPVVQDFLTTFDRLTDSERLDLASEILKRTAYLDFPPLSDEDLVLKIVLSLAVAELPPTILVS